MWALFGVASMGACPDTSGHDSDGQTGGVPSCIEVNPADCTPLYTPTWSNVYDNTIAPRCSTKGLACHASSEARGSSGGLVMTDENRTYETLLGQTGKTMFVEPGHARCSTLVVRLEIDDPDLRMPPGALPLDPSERCSITRWIDMGATRD